MLYYKKYEQGVKVPWVTLIHGAGASSAIWYKQIREYKKHFNVLLIDLRGHGKSQHIVWKKNDTFEDIAEEIIDVLNVEQINSSHFIGISLGTIVIQTIAQKYPERIESMVLGGAVTDLNFRTKFYISLGNAGKYIIPYLWLYRLFAWIIMPRKNHQEARNIFVESAKKMCQKEFIRWFSLTKNVQPFLQKLQKSFHNIPTLFVMGEEDYLFLDDVENIVLKSKENVGIQYIEQAGHVCNIDQPEQFNVVTVDFIKENSHLDRIVYKIC